MQIVFVAGLGSTGSSALIDLLKEVRTYYILENEFRLFVDPGGLVNLRDALVDNWSVFQSDIAIKNFRKMVTSLSSRWRSPNSHIDHTTFLDDQFIKRSNEYIDSLTELSFRGLWYGIDNIWLRQINKIPFLYRRKWTTKPVYVGKNLSDEQFTDLTHSYITSLIDYCLKKEEKQHFCFNENLSCMYPQKIINMVPGAKIINIIRDPKDVYADSVRVKWLAIPEDKQQYIQWQIEVYNGWMRVEDEAQEWDPEHKYLRVIRFEDLILNYDKTVDSIFEFLCIEKHDHSQKKVYLNPEVSAKNIGQWKNLITPEEADLFDLKFKQFYNRYDYDTNQ